MATTLHIPSSSSSDPPSIPAFATSALFDFSTPRSTAFLPALPAPVLLNRVLDRYHILAAREHQLLQQIRSCEVAPTGLVRLLASELQAVLSQKMNEVKVIIGDVNEVRSLLPAPQRPVSPPLSATGLGHRHLTTSLSSSSNGGCLPLPTQTQATLIVEEQPSGNVVANKYLEPPLIVKVNSNFKDLAREGKLQVAASLCLTLSEEVLLRTIDNKQNILQGHTVIPVTGDGFASFNKLKIMEVSSKHHHQAFSIQLQLQQTHTTSTDTETTTEVIPLGEAIKLAPLHVQSRINKRKRSLFGHSRPRKRPRNESDCNYVDITSLLVLPQKEAAFRLGISESMLCKRFKECTRRKWPYRYLRKIDKMIRYLTLNRKSDVIPKEDQEKIQKLKREREECLHPVKIRITGSDKIRAFPQSNSNDEELDDMDDGDGEEDEPENDDSPKEPTDSDSETSLSSPSPKEEDDEIAIVASTLNLLRQGAL